MSEHGKCPLLQTALLVGNTGLWLKGSLVCSGLSYITSALKSFLPASDPLHREGCPCTNPEKPKLKKMHARSVDSVALHNSQATERPPRRVGAAAGTRATGAAGVA